MCCASSAPATVAPPRLLLLARRRRRADCFRAVHRPALRVSRGALEGTLEAMLSTPTPRPGAGVVVLSASLHLSAPARRVLCLPSCSHDRRREIPGRASGPGGRSLRVRGRVVLSRRPRSRLPGRSSAAPRLCPAPQPIRSRRSIGIAGGSRSAAFSSSSRRLMPPCVRGWRFGGGGHFPWPRELCAAAHAFAVAGASRTSAAAACARAVRVGGSRRGRMAFLTRPAPGVGLGSLDTIR